MSEERTIRPAARCYRRRDAPCGWHVPAALGLALALSLSPRALANVYVYSDTFTLNAANSWQDISVQITRFNATALGDPRALQSIDFVFQATLRGNIGIENLDSHAQTITEVFGTTAALQLAGRTPLTLTSVSPTQTASVSLGGYDHNTNYRGSSGTTYAASATATSTYTSQSAADLSAFTGTGMITMAATAAGSVPTVVVSGDALKLPPSWITSGQSITGTLWVYYRTPEPGALALLAFGLATSLGRRPRRRA
jgi:hypothetical protein